MENKKEACVRYGSDSRRFFSFADTPYNTIFVYLDSYSILVDSNLGTRIYCN